VTRIISGRAKSLRLAIPRGATRPTSERVREAMFSAIEHGMDIDGARVLDLYAGSGALGFEALSRGARSLVAVESAQAAITTLRANGQAIRALLDPGVSIDIVKAPARTFCRNLTPAQAFDLVVMDPPYEVGNEEVVDCLVDLTRCLTEEALVVVERSKRSAPPAWPGELTCVSEKTYGDTAVYFLQLAR
jgi:16S rRNA (guanine966-N2)-methyltransferase